MAKCRTRERGKATRMCFRRRLQERKRNNSARERSRQDTRRCNRLAACVMSAHMAMLGSPLASQHARLSSTAVAGRMAPQPCQSAAYNRTQHANYPRQRCCINTATNTIKLKSEPGVMGQPHEPPAQPHAPKPQASTKPCRCCKLTWYAVFCSTTPVKD